MNGCRAGKGNRSIAVVSACMNANGLPEFVRNEVAVTEEEHGDGLHYVLVEDLLLEQGHEEPFVHFDQFEAPDFLLQATLRPTNQPAA